MAQEVIPYISSAFRSVQFSARALSILNDLDTIEPRTVHDPGAHAWPLQERHPLTLYRRPLALS